MYKTYYLRCLPVDYDELVSFGCLLGVIQMVPGDNGLVVTPVGDGAWDFVGEILGPTGNMITVGDETVPEVEPIKDANGTPYLHMNLRTTIDIFERAQELAAVNPAIAAALGNVGKYFVPGEPGRARAPNSPRRVFL